MLAYIALLLSLLLIGVEPRGRVQINVYRFGKRINFSDVDVAGSVIKNITSKLETFGVQLTQVDNDVTALAKKVGDIKKKVDSGPDQSALLAKVDALDKGLKAVESGLKGRVDAVAKDLTNVEKGLAKRLETSEKAVQKLNADVGKSKSDNAASNQKIAALTKSLADLDKAVKAEKAKRVGVEARLGKVEKDMASTKPAPLISFVASASIDTTVSQGDNVKFNDVTFSRGGGYDVKTGQFTAPSSGYYVFHVTLLALHLEKIEFDLMANGKRAVEIKSGLSYPATSASNSAMVRLEKGQVAVVKARRGAKVIASSTFFGYLLRE